MSPPILNADRRARFAEIYERSYEDVVRFVRRRAPDETAEDVTHEAFLIAWQRLEDVPAQPLEARAWVFGVARHLIRSTGRNRVRRDGLAVEIGHLLPASPIEADDTAFRLDLIDAWRRLSPDQQEVLSLQVWEQLPPRLAAEVLRVSTATYRVRLHRARAALRRHMDSPSPIFTRTATATVLEKNA